MGKTKTNASVILTLVAGILAIVAAILYRNVMYRFQPVYIMLIAAAVIAVLHCFLVGRMPRLAGYCPVCMAPLLASAAVWGSQLMVNQLGYVYAGLDGMGTVMTGTAETTKRVLRQSTLFQKEDSASPPGAGRDRQIVEAAMRRRPAGAKRTAGGASLFPLA